MQAWEHFRLAEDHLTYAAESNDPEFHHQRAQVHATLALVAWNVNSHTAGPVTASEAIDQKMAWDRALNRRKPRS